MTYPHLTAVAVLAFPALAFGQDCTRPWIDRAPVAITRTVEQDATLRAAADRIIPRLPDGTPDPSGTIGLVILGMSNTAGIGEAMKATLERARYAPPDLHPRLTFVNLAQGSQASAEWANPACDCWTAHMDAALANASVTRAQVGAVITMMTVKNPKQGPVETAAAFDTYHRQILELAAHHFPHATIAMPGANYYGGYDIGQDKTPEPHQWQQTTTLQGLQDTFRSPLALAAWHAWTDGERVRDDGLYLRCEDMTEGGVHQVRAAKQRFAANLIAWLWAQPWTLGWLRE